MNKSFTQTLIEYEEIRKDLIKHQSSAIAAIRQTRSSAYRLAERFVYMRDKCLDEFREAMKARYPGEKAPFDKAIAEDFAALETIGDDPYELFRFIAEGVTRQEYMIRGGLAIAGAKKKASGKAESPVPVPDEPKAELPIDEQLRRWKIRAISLQQEVKRLRDVERENVLLRRRIKKIEGIIRTGAVAA